MVDVKPSGTLNLKFAIIIFVAINIALSRLCPLPVLYLPHPLAPVLVR